MEEIKQTVTLQEGTAEAAPQEENKTTITMTRERQKKKKGKGWNISGIFCVICCHRRLSK